VFFARVGNIRSMAVSQQDIDNLNAAIARGARSVTIGGQTVIYNTTESLIKARDDLVKQMRGQQGARRPKQTYLFHKGRGY
jgi:hypothetical protein